MTTTPIAILELNTWSEIGALIAIISAVWGVLSAILVMWLNTKYPNKKAYYADKREAGEVITALDKRIADVERAQSLANAPITALQASVNEMKEQLRTLTTAVGGMKDSVGEAIHKIDTRVVVLETSKRKR